MRYAHRVTRSLFVLASFLVTACNSGHPDNNNASRSCAVPVIAGISDVPVVSVVKVLPLGETEAEVLVYAVFSNGLLINYDEDSGLHYESEIAPKELVLLLDTWIRREYLKSLERDHYIVPDAGFYEIIVLDMDKQQCLLRLGSSFWNDEILTPPLDGHYQVFAKVWSAMIGDIARLSPGTGRPIEVDIAGVQAIQ